MTEWLNAYSIPFDDVAYKYACLYIGLTELYDRGLTDMRSPHDKTEAFICSSIDRSPSNWYANTIIKKVSEECSGYGITWSDVRKSIHMNNCLSAQGWVDEYYRLWRENNGE